jgi:hypothetical protein
MRWDYRTIDSFLSYNMANNHPSRFKTFKALALFWLYLLWQSWRNSQVNASLFRIKDLQRLWIEAVPVGGDCH